MFDLISHDYHVILVIVLQWMKLLAVDDKVTVLSQTSCSRRTWRASFPAEKVASAECEKLRPGRGCDDV